MRREVAGEPALPYALLDLHRPAPALLLLVHLRQVGLSFEPLPLGVDETPVHHGQLALAQPRLQPLDVIEVRVACAGEQQAALHRQAVHLRGQLAHHAVPGLNGLVRPDARPGEGLLERVAQCDGLCAA